MSHPLIRIVPVSLALGAMVAAATIAHPTLSGGAAEPIDTDLPPAQTALVCPPPPALAEGAEGAGTDAGFAAQPVAPVSTLAAFTYRSTGAPATLSAYTVPTDGPPETLTATTKGTVNAVEGARPTPVWLTAAPDAQGSPPIGALTTTITSEGDLAGLSASTCTPADSAGWLVAGGVAAGRSGRVVLSNPGATPVTVDLQVLTGAGRENPPSGQDLVIAPGATRQVLLEGLLTTSGPIAIGFAAQGGQVAGHLVDSELAGIVPRGVEQIPATRSATRLVITPVTSAGTHVLRLANPGTEPAQISWRFIGAAGTIPSADQAGAAVPAGQASDLEIAVPKDAIGIEISCETAILGSLTTTVERDSPNGRAADDAVFTAGPPLGASNIVAAGPVGSTIGLIAGAEATTVEIRQVDRNGTAVTANQTLALPADTARTVALAPGAALALIQVTAGSAHGGVRLVAGDGGQFVAGAPIQPPATSQQSVAVHVVPRP